LSDLKEIIAKYHESDDKNLTELSDKVVYELISNGLEVPEIDKLLIHILRVPDYAKFKWYRLYKFGDKAKCVICGVKDGLQLHHLKTVNNYPELAYNEDNVCFLCDSCHKIIHYGGGKNTDKTLKSKIKLVFKQVLNKNLNKFYLLFFLSKF